MLPPTSTRVQKKTRRDINERIRLQTERNLAFYASAPEEIDSRLFALDHEWDVERVLETNAAIFGLLGIFFGVFVHPVWLFFTIVVLAFLLQHALQGWCPPVSLFRRLGVRTSSEIDSERYALKLIRGDFAVDGRSGQPCARAASEALSAVEH